MRAVVQRVTRADVRIDGASVGRIGTGLVVLVGAGQRDGQADVEWLADKVLALRVFPDDEGLMNRGVGEAGGAILAVSQFTLFGDCRKGRRPSFTDALAPGPAEALYHQFVARLGASGVPVEQGRFGANMQVELVNDGPVTFLLDSSKLF